MKKKISEKTRRGITPIIVLGITMLALLMLVSVVATIDTVAAAETDKVVKDSSQKVTLHIVNKVIVNNIGSDITVSWTKADSKKSVFKVYIPADQTRTVTVSTGNFDEYVLIGSTAFRVMPGSDTGHTQLKSGYEYTSTYYMVSNGTNLKRISDSDAAEIFK